MKKLAATVLATLFSIAAPTLAQNYAQKMRDASLIAQIAQRQDAAVSRQSYHRLTFAEPHSAGVRTPLP